MKAKMARLTVVVTVLASMALTLGAGIRWGAMSVGVNLGF
jgi:hypothetical protein